MDLKTLKDIPSSFMLAKRALVICMIVSLTTVFGTLAWAFLISQELQDRAFIISENGAAAFAVGADVNKVDTYRKPEIINHTRTFHDLFWNIDQFNYAKKADKSFYLIGASGKQLYLSLKAQGHYSKIESQNLIQNLKIDSIVVNDKITPYKTNVYGKLVVTRTDQKNKKTNKFHASFDVFNVSRTVDNPHGLLIENYTPRTDM